MLTGTKAFEARWQSLKAAHHTNAVDNRTLMQAMGRLVENYATQEEIMQELPERLQSLFGRLVDAYLNGYWLEDSEPSTPVGLTPAVLAAKQRQPQRLQPTDASEAATYIIADRLGCWA